MKPAVRGAVAYAWFPAAFGRLCVETAAYMHIDGMIDQPPSGGCVLKLWPILQKLEMLPSRLRAAVC